MPDSINCGEMMGQKEVKLSKPDKTVNEPFCIQAEDQHGMFRFIARSVPDSNNKGD